jgi:NarL family two-component system response regulator LiaR
MAGPIRVLIADDHAVVRYGLRALFSSEPSLEVVGEAADGVSAVAQAQALHPDVLLLDLLMPGKDGVEVIKDVMQAAPDVRILVLTSFVDDEHLFPALRAGAYGYLLKESPPTELIQGIHDVVAGKSPLDPVIARRVLQELVQPPAPPAAAEALTDRETDVLGLVAQGRSNKAIAAELHLSERTVRSHVSSILAKLHLSSRTEAALYALRTGLAQLEGQTS